jgi:pyrimidine-nucleoside phosphorylase
MSVSAIDIIRCKRDGGILSESQIRTFIEAAAHSHWPDYQLAALLMAIWLKGMTREEASLLTSAMTQSGRRYRWDTIAGPKVDKHSTGGVGDKTSLVLGPLAAACGVVVPMMSGRGLGHTGGTLDKLESIPGFRVGLSEQELDAALRQVGIGMIGQSADVAPADRKLYALRDVTATVECIPLITASILSKKLAEGIDALVMDVKFGHGAFMKRVEDARQLAEWIVSVGNANGVRTQALLTDMNAPLGRAIGNALEVKECIDVLQGRGDARLTDLCLQLTARMIMLAGLEPDETAARARADDALRSGAGLERFARMCEQQGGDPNIVEEPARLPQAPFVQAMMPAPQSGFITEMQAEWIGRACMKLGSGRNRAEDPVDHAVGFVLLKQRGESIERGEPWLEVHSRQPGLPPDVEALLKSAIQIEDQPPEMLPLVHEVIS